MIDPVAALADERFVSLTTFRRSGEPVPTPVWVAREGDDLVVTTGAASGKVKRLRREPRALLRPCDRRGRVAEGAAEYDMHAEVVTDPGRQESPTATLAAKYGVEWRVLTVVERVVGLFRGGTRERAILRLAAPPHGPDASSQTSEVVGDLQGVGATGVRAARCERRPGVVRRGGR